MCETADKGLMPDQTTPNPFTREIQRAGSTAVVRLIMRRECNTPDLRDENVRGWGEKARFYKGPSEWDVVSQTI